MQHEVLVGTGDWASAVFPLQWLTGKSRGWENGSHQSLSILEATFGKDERCHSPAVLEATLGKNETCQWQGPVVLEATFGKNERC